MTQAGATHSSQMVSALGNTALLGVLAIGVAECASVHPSVPPSVTSCLIGSPQPDHADTLSVAALAPVEWSHVPASTNSTERFAFAQLYETLIDVDCEGRAQPGLATSWTLDATKTRISLSLRRNAMFWSGKPVTADDVLAAWRRTAAQSTSSASLAREIAGGTTVVDDHTLIVSLPDTSWMVLAGPALAIYEQQATARWPEGSGPYRIAEQSAPGGFVLMPIASQSAPYLASRRVPSGDPRDAIDAGSDVLVTDDPVAVGYAHAAANLVTGELPWARSYALAVPGVPPTIISRLIQPDSESARLRESLARDAVHVQARAAQLPYWWDTASNCTPIADSLLHWVAPDLRSNRVVYRRDDSIARGLAERLVALDQRSVAAGLAPNDFARALRDGSELAYMLDLPRASGSPCSDVRLIRSAAPWLMSGLDADAKLVPLVDTRETAILKRNRVSATVDWSGTLHFSRP